LINAEFKIDKRLQKKILARYQGYELTAGILENSPYRAALPARKGLATVEGGPARKKSSRVRSTVADVGEAIRTQQRIDYLRAPVRQWRSVDMKAFRDAFSKFLAGASKSRSQTETALRAVIRNPILHGRYGRNTPRWARVKTFNRKLIDTGQFFRAIIARVRSKKK
jgi:hypothetical protein